MIQQAYVEGVSTRRVDDLIKALGCDGISSSQVSRICAEGTLFPWTVCDFSLMDAIECGIVNWLPPMLTRG